MKKKYFDGEVSWIVFEDTSFLDEDPDRDDCWCMAFYEDHEDEATGKFEHRRVTALWHLTKSDVERLEPVVIANGYELHSTDYRKEA